MTTVFPSHLSDISFVTSIAVDFVLSRPNPTMVSRIQQKQSNILEKEYEVVIGRRALSDIEDSCHDCVMEAWLCTGDKQQVRLVIMY
jgi:MarR-like DNA-binding transcriptional regulator SgrR of sgrS sRNA